MALVLCLVSILSFAQSEEPSQPMVQPEEQPVSQPAIQVDGVDYVTQAELQQSIYQMNEQYQKQFEQYQKQLETGGFRLEKAGRQLTGALVVSAGGLLFGGLWMVENDIMSVNVGSIIVCAAEVTSIVLVCCGVHNIRKSGLMLQGNGIAYKF